MLYILILCTALIALTVVIHAVALDQIIRRVSQIEAVLKRLVKGARLPKPMIVTAIVMGIMAAHSLEIWLWAACYYFMHALGDFSGALYFSTTAFTTVGFGDGMPDGLWRLAGAIESADGFMLFGWSTAFTFEVLTQIYRKEGAALR